MSVVVDNSIVGHQRLHDRLPSFVFERGGELRVHHCLRLYYCLVD